MNGINQPLQALDNFINKLGAIDNEIRTNILGYVGWFSPIPKEELYKMLGDLSYDRELVMNNALALKQNELLIETDRFYLENKGHQEAREICAQAMGLVMPEILKLLDREEQ